MYSNIKQLRQRGVRRSDREIGSDPGIFGAVTLVSCAGHLVLSVHAWGDSSHRAPLIPLLYDAVLVSMHTNRMLFRGFQRVGRPDDKTAPTYAQEWTVTLVSEYPPESELERLNRVA
jgi:hypothetical protein